MKTAMQELIELLELNTTNEPLPYLIDVIKEVYIQKEKEQIMNDFENGWLDCFNDKGTDKEEYYNQTYKQKK
jgi:predicted metal-dependent peptidase